MTAHTIKGRIAFSCDSCPEAYEPHEQSDFAAAWAEAQALGWRAFKRIARGYDHQCPVCAREEARLR